MHWYFNVLTNYAEFSGRVGRKEYWMFILFNIPVVIGLVLIDILIQGKPFVPSLFYIYCVATFLPHLGAVIRRLHDIDFSARWYLIGFLPIVGGVVLLFLLAKKGSPGENRYGPVPLTPAAPDVMQTSGA